MKRLHDALCGAIGGLLAMVIVAACTPTTQGPSDVTILTAEEAALQNCIEQAKATDAGLPYYEGCAKAVEASFHDAEVQE